MKKILITGATGNIGTEVLRSPGLNNSNQIIAGVRNIAKAKHLFPEFKDLQYREFDFEDPHTFDSALENIDCVFLLRPPHISDVDKYFSPLIRKIKEKGVRQIVFLSVQGAEKSKIIPHNKIEKLIRESGLEFIFLRPSYFMQNLTTALLQDIKLRSKIVLPAGKAKFNWIDIKNIGELAAKLLSGFDFHKNLIVEITGPENLDFYEAASILSDVTGKKIDFENVNPIRFFRLKKKEGLQPGLIIVMTMLHFLPRLQKAPEISDNFEAITGNKPTTLRQFIEREKQIFL